MNTEVCREPISPEQIRQDIEDVFIFNPPLSAQNATSCQRIQSACKTLAQIIAEEVPEGKERIMAINNVLSAALFARHGVTRRQVVLIAAAVPLPEPTVVESTPAPAQT